MSTAEGQPRSCAKCGGSFLYDGYTFCPRCDSEATAAMSGVLPDAAARVLAMRTKEQGRLRALNERKDTDHGNER